MNNYESKATLIVKLNIRIVIYILASGLFKCQCHYTSRKPAVLFNSCGQFAVIFFPISRFFSRHLKRGTLEENLVTDGSKLTLLPLVESGLVVSVATATRSSPGCRALQRADNTN